MGNIENGVNPGFNLGVVGLVLSTLGVISQVNNGYQVLKDLTLNAADKVNRAFAETPKTSAQDTASAEPFSSEVPPSSTDIPSSNTTLGEDLLERTGEMAQAFFAKAYEKTAEFADSVDDQIYQNLPWPVSSAWWWIPDSFKVGGSIALAFWLLGIWPFGQRVNVTQNVFVQVTKEQEVTTAKKGSDVFVKVSPKNRNIVWDGSNSSAIQTVAAAYLAGRRAGLDQCPRYEKFGGSAPRRID